MSFFRAVEFECRCGRLDCDAPKMKELFLGKLETVRALWAKPMVVTSGSRCEVQNQHAKGAGKSQHLEGNAADILVASRAEANEIAVIAEKVGLGGIGIGSHFIHLDDGPAGRRWTYP